MKTISFTLCLLVISYTVASAQTELSSAAKRYPLRILTLEPSLGIHTNFGTDLLISNLIQWNPRKRLSLGAHTSFNINNILQRSFNNIQTDYNYTINQKFGMGTSIYAQKSAHTFLLMMGVKYTAYQETLDHPGLDKKVSYAISAWSPDYGLLYSYKRGFNKFYFTYRMYLPLYPFPMKSSDINSIDGNMNNIALEFGLGIKLK